MEIFAFSGLINGIVAFFFGGLVFSKDWRNRRNQLYFLMTLAVGFWALSYWQWLSSSVEEDALMWIRYVALASMYIPLFFFHWITNILNVVKENRYVIRVSYVVVFALSTLAFTKYMVPSVEPKLIFDFWPNAGIAYTAYLIIIFFGLVSYSLFLMDRHYRDGASEEIRGQILYTSLGMFFGFGGGFMNFPLWYDIPLIPYGNIVVAFFPFFLGYAALRYSLFSVKVIATELLTFAVWIFILLRILVSENASDRVLDIGLLLLLVGAGFLLIKSVRKEVQTNEHLEKLTKKLESTNEDLQELDRQKDQFLSIASHQFRSPLTAIKGYGSLLMEGAYGKIPEKMKEPIDRMFKSADALTLIVEDFLNISRIEQGRMTYNFENTDIADMVKEVVDEQRVVIEGKGLKLTFKASKKGSYVSKIDVGKIRQVIINLIDNAAKYTPKGTISVEVDKSHGQILVSIKDTGVGISEDNINKLFKLFARTKNAHKVNVSGTGLGLYVAKQMVEAHGGRVWAESKGEGKGSTFFMEIDELKK